MRTSSTILAFVLAAAVSTPAFGALLQSDFCDRYPHTCKHLARDTQLYDRVFSSNDIAKLIGAVVKARYK